MGEHEHNFGEPRENSVMMCAYCTEMRVGTNSGWRELTPTEKLDVVAVMMEDIAVAQAMQIVHGKKRGMQRFREWRGWEQR